MSRLILLALCAGCALVSQEVRQAPLDTDGEVRLRARLDQRPLELVSAAALRSDGSSVPVEASSAKPGPDRVLASGPLAPGQYDGFLLVVRTSRGPDTVRVDAPFAISARRATLVWARLRGDPPELSQAPAPRTLPQLSGYCSSAGKNDLDVFDVAAVRATAAIPTGRAPWGIALDTVASRVFVALSGDDQIAAVDLLSATELFRIRLSAGDDPRELLLTPDRKLLVSANAGSGTVSFVDPSAMVETGRLRVGDEPVSLLLDRRSPRLYVFNQRGGSVSVVDLGSRSLVGSIPIGNAPLRGQIDARGTRLYVASATSPDLQVFSLPALAPLQRVHVGLGTSALAVDTNTDLLYVANQDGRVSIFDPFSLAPIDFFELPGAARYLAIDAGQDALFALLPFEVVSIRLTTKAVTGRFDAGADPRVLALFRERN